MSSNLLLTQPAPLASLASLPCHSSLTKVSFSKTLGERKGKTWDMDRVELHEGKELALLWR